MGGSLCVRSFVRPCASEFEAINHLLDTDGAVVIHALGNHPVARHTSGRRNCSSPSCRTTTSGMGLSPFGSGCGAVGPLAAIGKADSPAKPFQGEVEGVCGGGFWRKAVFFV